MIKRTVAIAAVVLATVVASLAAVPATASAAGPWFVGPGGNDAANCLSVGTRCLTIQATLNKASAGDTVNVADGVYNERLSITKAVDLVATNPGAVTINGSSGGTTIGVLVLTAAPGNIVRLRGVQITGGLASFGGGIAHFAGDLRLENSDLRNNTASFGGGAWVGATASLTVTGGQVRDNTAASGGGIYGYGTAGAFINGVTLAGVGAVVTVDGASVTGNVANGGAALNAGNGGAIVNAGSLTVTGSTFSANRAIASTNASSLVRGLGGAIYTGPLDADDAPTASISGTTINNTGLGVGLTNATSGGGIASMANVLGATNTTPSTLTVAGTTIDGQRLVASGLGGGLYLTTSASISGSTISNNTTTGNGGGIHVIKSPATAPAPVVGLAGTTVLANTATTGGGIVTGNDVTLNITAASTIDNNQAVNAAGIFSGGTTKVANSTITSNDATFQGGGIYAIAVGAPSPTVELTSTVVSLNTAANAGGGLIAFAPTTVTVNGGSFTSNSAVLGGGATIWDGAVGSFTGTAFATNVATLAYGGGGLYNAGTSTIDGTTFSGNTTPGHGGAIFNGTTTNNATASVSVDRSTFTSNVAGTYGGAIYSGTNLLFASGGTTATGTTSKVTVDRSTFTGNTAQTGSVLLPWTTVAGTNTSSISRSTLHANPSTAAASGALATFHPIAVSASTITDNTPASIIQTAVGLVTVSGSIVSGAATQECNGAVTDGGRNLADVGDTNCGFSGGANDTFGAHLLGPLASNGGPTQTRLPGASSPAINKIPGGPLCVAGSTDQRGTARPQGATCDIGSVEVAVSAPVITGPASATYTVGAGHADVVFTSSGVPTPTMSLLSGTLPTGITFTPGADGSGTLSGFPTSGPGGQYPIVLKATNSEGSDTHEFTITVNEAPGLSGPASATFAAGVADSAGPFQQTAGFPVAGFTVVGTLPGTVAIVDHGDGTAHISGTAPVGSGGVYPVTVVADNGTDPDATLPFTLTVTEAPTIAGPASDTFTVGVDGTSSTFTTTGYPEATLTATGLPADVTLVDNGDGTAQLEGIPADGTGGVYPGIIITASNGIAPDATKAFTLTVNESPTLAGAAALAIVVGLPGSTGYTTTGFPEATLTSVGALPTGVTFVDNGDGTGTLGGTPGAGTEGNYPITITASNGVAPDATLDVVVTIEPHVVITTTSLPHGAVGSTYSAPVLADGGLPPYEFAVIAGTLPAGLSLAEDGTISGAATGPAGTSVFTVQVTDGSQPEPQTDTQILEITIDRGATTLTANPVLIEVKKLLGIKISVGTVSATLRGGVPAKPIGGQPIVFKAGATTVCSGVTAADGTVTCSMTVPNTLLVILNNGVTATYAGSTSWLPAAGTAPLLSLS